MPVLLTADIHQTDNPRDDHRWGLFDWMSKQVKAYACSHVVIAGDLTDAKDHHSAVLVNRFVEGLRSLTSSGARVIILKGNHDYIDPAWPFFGFSTSIEGVVFVREPARLSLGSLGDAYFLPSTADYGHAWGAIPDLFTVPYIFTHQTYDGCKAENGSLLPGIPPAYFRDFEGVVWSGDIHVPQSVSRNVHYIGAPYRMRFGDTYEPRCVVLNDNETYRDIRFPCRTKHLLTVSAVADLVKEAQREGVRKDDQVKVRVRLRRGDYPLWPQMKLAIRDAAVACGWDLYGPELVALEVADRRVVSEEEDAQGHRKPDVILSEYVTAKRAGEALQQIGLDLLSSVTGNERP